MTIGISRTRFSTDDMLYDLILQSLDKIIGSPHQVISRDLPFTTGHPILALDCDQRVILIVFDRHNGGQALLNGLKILESLETHRASVFHLYPELFGNDQHALRCDDIELLVLAPTTPPGGDYLHQRISRLHIFTFQSLLINGEACLLIDPPTAITPQQSPGIATSVSDKNSTGVSTETNASFRPGIPPLKKSEEDYFRDLNITA